MASGEQAAVLEGVRRIFDGGSAAGLGSDSLLRRFAATGDEAAFAGIVARHGPTVFAVCRRALRDPHDVEDAFQATFLVFVRRAGSIRDGEGVGPWLHGVARRVSARSRAIAARRRATERSGLAVEAAAPGVDPERGEMTAVVDEEIGRLPERYRRAIVLCDLEGCTQAEAAVRLGWTEGSLRGRLARGRDMLRSRLRRRGLVVPAGAIGGLAATDAVSAARLGEAMTRAMKECAAIGGEGVSARSVALAGDILGAMMKQKLMTVAAAALVAGLGLTGIGALAQGVAKGDRPAPRSGGPAEAKRRPPAPPIDPAPEGEDPKAAPVSGPPEPPRLEDLPEPEAPGPEPANAMRIAVGDLVLVEVLEAMPGRQVTGERIVRPDGTISLQWYGDVPIAGLTRREAKARVVEQLRQFLTDQSLGLIVWDDQKQTYLRVHPSRTTRVFLDESPTYDPRVRQRLGMPAEPRPAERPAKPGARRTSDPSPMTFQSGNHLLIEVLEALPGRPISGERIVRPDGTISLGFYGDLKVVGLTRDQVKAKAIEHLRQWLTDEALGLVVRGKDGTTVRVPPARSTAIFVDETDWGRPEAKGEGRLDALERKLDRVLEELQALRKERDK